MAWIYIVHLQCRIIRFNPDYPLHPRRGWLPTPVFLPGQFHGQRDLVGYSLWGCKESDSTGRLALWFSISFSIWPLLFSCSVVSNSLRPHALQHDRFPVHHQLLELAQTYVHWVGDAIQPSCPLSSPSPALNLSQHWGLFQLVASLHQVARVLELRLSISSCN